MWNTAVSNRIKAHGSKVFVGDLVYQKNSTEEVEEITEENISNYSIEDVVFPLIGKSIKFPNNQFKDEMLSIMKEDELTL